jgi:hypothetical protein
MKFHYQDGQVKEVSRETVDIDYMQMVDDYLTNVEEGRIDAPGDWAETNAEKDWQKDRDSAESPEADVHESQPFEEDSAGSDGLTKEEQFLKRQVRIGDVPEGMAYGSPDHVLGIRRFWSVTPSSYQLELDRHSDLKCCKGCGLGWELASATVREVGDIDFDYLLGPQVSTTDKMLMGDDGYRNLYSALTKIADEPLDDITKGTLYEGLLPQARAIYQQWKGLRWLEVQA